MLAKHREPQKEVTNENQQALLKIGEVSGVKGVNERQDGVIPQSNHDHIYSELEELRGVKH